jgi:hypothetical protein
LEIAPCDLRAVYLLPGHAKLESTVRYPGIEVDDTLEIAEQIAASAAKQCQVGICDLVTQQWIGQSPSIAA